MPTIAYFLASPFECSSTTTTRRIFTRGTQGFRARVRIADGEVIGGRLPPTARWVVKEWTALRRDALMRNWHLARTDGELEKIGGLDDD
jgi:Domain of unknown function (DUF4160)